MLHSMIATAFKDIEKPHHVVLYVGVGIVDGIAHTGLPRQVAHMGKLAVGHQVLHGLAVGDVHLLEPYVGPCAARGGKVTVGVDAQVGQSRFLESWRIVIVEVVDAHNFDFGIGGEGFGQRMTDETRRTCYEYFHDCFFLCLL